MHLLTTPQSLAWLRDHTPNSADPGRAAAGHLHRVEAYIEPWPAHDLRALARRAAGWLLRLDAPRGLILIQDPHVIPSREDLFLYSLLRGDDHPVEEAPGHLFEARERAAAESLLWLALSFGWGLFAAAEGSSDAITADNDGHFRFLSEQPGQLDEPRDWLAARARGS